jgi:hypothetical protein
MFGKILHFSLIGRQQARQYHPRLHSTHLSDESIDTSYQYRRPTELCSASSRILKIEAQAAQRPLHTRVDIFA